MAQTSYSGIPASGFPGMLADAGESRISSKVNENATAQPFGIGVKPGTAARGFNVLGAATDALAGILVNDNAHAVDGLTGSQGVASQDIANVLDEGAVWVLTEVALNPGDPVYVRFAAGTGTQIGAFRKDNDTNTARLVKGARVVQNASATLALVYFSKSVDVALRDPDDSTFATASVAATTTTALMKTRTDRQFVVTGVDYIEPLTGIAQSDTNYYVLSLQVGATVIAQYSTKLTGGNGPITAGAFAAFVMQALANTVVPPGSVLNFVETLTGTLTAPAGSLTLHGYYI